MNRLIRAGFDHEYVKAGDVEFDAVVRIDTPGEADYYRHGGIMPYVLRQLLGSAPFSDSKLALARGLRTATATSSLGQLLGVSGADEDDLYAAMDWVRCWPIPKLGTAWVTPLT